MSKRISITIDGPAGAGKSTVARKLAEHLGFTYIDTGAMYRAVTYKALREGVDLKDEEALSRVAAAFRFEVAADKDGIPRVYLDGEEVTEEIRSPAVSRNVSLVARVGGVRKEMVRRQREMARNGNVVMEGRDAGTVILPEAEFKFFLTASREERARRRQAELREKGLEVSLEQMAAEIEERDRIDSTREVSPLHPAHDAQIIDCSQLSAEEVVRVILGRIGRSRP
jgi:cytidylate kinase